MTRKKSKLRLAQEEAELAIKKTNKIIDKLGEHTSKLYDNLTKIQELFDKIRNVPDEKWLEYEKLKKIRLNWKQQAEKIEADYKHAVLKSAGKGAASVGAGVAVATLGPTAAMGVATTFGVASTGTAISTLSGAAATNAALAWLGGGAISVGGGGMAAGNAFLAMAGPVGWSIAAVALVGSGLMFWKARSDQKRLEDIFTLISKRDVKSYELAMVELNERINRIKDETGKLETAIDNISIFGLDYEKMTEAQHYELGAYVNLMNSSTQLLINPILGLQPKYTDDDLDKFLAYKKLKLNKKVKATVMSLSNLLYKIDIDDKDRKLMWSSFKKNKKFLEALGISKKEFELNIFNNTDDALRYKYVH